MPTLIAKVAGLLLSASRELCLNYLLTTDQKQS